MAVLTLYTRSRGTSASLFRFFSLSFSYPSNSRHSQFFSSHPSPPDDVNEISRVLSDFRLPQHDLELALTPFSSKISADLVEQVLKRTKNLGFSAHRFFLWARRFAGFKPNVNSYKILTDVLGSCKQFPLIWDLLSEVRESKDIELCPEIFWVIFGAYCRANLPNDAIRAFNRMTDFGLRPRLNDLDHLLYLLCKRKFVTHGQEFFDKVKFQFAPSVKSYSILIRGWGDIGNSVEARKVFDEMIQRGCTVDVPACNSLLDALCNGGDFDEAYLRFREMASKGLDPDAFTYSIFIRSYCKRDNIHSVFRVLDRMKRYNLVPNVYTYNCIIKKLCTSGKVDDAYQLLDEIIKSGVDPDICSYNTILAYHCDHFEVNRALRILSRMEKENCRPDRHTYNMLLKMLFRVGRFDRVEEVWDNMPVRGFYPSVSTYAVMIHGFLKKKGKLEEACKYFEIMIDEGIPPYSSTIDLLRSRLLGLGFLEQIDILADKMGASSSSTIKELSKTMRGHRSNRRRREEESSELSEDEWPFRPDIA